jgi:DNA excision repair protein ERCC-4
MIEEQVFNQEPQDMLGVVPGVTPQNIRYITANAENIRDVANMEMEELEPMVGRASARQIYGFFNRNVMDEEG